MHEGSMQTTKGKAVTEVRKIKTRLAEARLVTFSVCPGAFESANNGKDLWTQPKASCEPDKPHKDGGFTRVRDIARIARSGWRDYAWMAEDREALAAVQTGATRRSCSIAARRGRNETALLPPFSGRIAAFQDVLEMFPNPCYVQFPNRAANRQRSTQNHGTMEEIKSLTAYVSEERDREMNTFFLVSICDDDANAIIKEISGYDRNLLIEELLREYPDIKVENA